MTLDTNKVSCDMLNSIADDIANLSATMPDTPDMRGYIEHWTRIMREGTTDPNTNPELRVEALKNMTVSLGVGLAYCINRGCDRNDQHLFMAAVIVIIQEQSEKYANMILEDLMGNDDFIQSIFNQINPN